MVGAVDAHWYDGRVRCQREKGGSLLKGLETAVMAASSFWKNEKNSTIVQESNSTA